MNVYANKSKDVKSAAITNSTPQQHKSEKTFLVDNRPTAVAQRKLQETQPPGSKPIQKRKNETGLPDNLKAGVETLSGMGMDDVKVHYNSSQPAQLQALAYAQGTNIHIAPGQEKHLPHEAWHVAQQKQGRVKSNFQQKKGVNINDDAGLESEADQMGEKALQIKPTSNASIPDIQRKAIRQTSVVQRVIGEGKVPGTKVIDKTTKQVYLITRYTSKGYELIHNAIKAAPRYVLPTDAEYDVFADADVTAAPVASASASVFSSISSLFSGSKDSPTTSGSHEKARRDDIAKAWPKITSQVNQIKQEAIHIEKSKPGASAFYNAAGLGAHTLHQIILAIYEEVHEVSTRNHVFFRAPGNAPRPEALEGPQAFLNSRKEGLWSDHQERDSMMSVNMSVSANTADKSESTFNILQSGGLFDVDPKKTVEIIGRMLYDMGMTGEYAAIILTEVKRLALSINEIKERNGSKSTEAVLYQTFIPKSLIPKLVYIAQKNGHPLNEISTLNPEKALSGIVAAGKELKNAELLAYGKFVGNLERMPPDKKKALFQSNEFTRDVLIAAKTESFWAAFNGDADPQARILIDPKAFAEPSGQVETITHSNLSRDTIRTLDIGLTTIRGAVKHVKQQQLIDRINDRIELYGAVFERFHKLQAQLPKLPMRDLQAIFNDTTPIITEVDEAIQKHVADFIGDHPQIKPIIKAGLMVKCRGKVQKYDLNTPARMLPAEFKELCALLIKLSVPAEIPDLLTF